MFLIDLIPAYFDKQIPYFDELIDFNKLSNLLNKSSSSPLKLVIDADSCMNRMTGGFYPDWQSGGQWLSLKNFYSELKKACHKNSIEIVIFFNGTYPGCSINEWHKKQIDIRRRANRIYKSNTQPHPENWIRPVYSTQSIIYELNRELCLDNDINSKNVYCYNTYKDHKKDIINYCIQHKCDGLITNSIELINLAIVNSRFENLKELKFYQGQTFKLSVKEEISATRLSFEIAVESLKMTPQKYGLFTALLGFDFNVMKLFYKKILPFKNLDDNDLKRQNMDIVKYVVAFIQAKEDEINFQDFVDDVFKDISDQNLEQYKISLLERINYIFLCDFDPEPSWVRNREELIDNPYLSIISNPSENENILKKKESEEPLEATTDPQFDLHLKQLHVNCLKSPQITHLINKREFYIPTVLEAMTGEFKRGDEIFSSIRKKCYSVLLSGEVGQKAEEIRLCYETNNIQRYKLKVTPYHTRNKLDYIWQTSRKNRKLIFLDCIDADNYLTSNNVYKTSFDLFIPCIVIRYMIKQRLVNENDIRAFLACFDKLTYKKSKEYQEPRDLRATSLASIFLQGVKTFSFANDVCGNPFKFRCFYLKNFFDGNEFQNCYQKINKDDPQMKAKYASKNFIQMYEFVTLNLKSYILEPGSKVMDKIEENHLNRNEKPSKKYYLGRGLLSKKNLEKSAKPGGLFDRYENDESKFDLDQFDDIIIDNKAKNSHRTSSPIRETEKTKKNLFEEKLIKFPLEHFKLQQEVLNLIKILDSKKPREPEKRALRYVFSDELIKKYQQKEITVKPKKTEQKYPEFVKLIDYPVLIDYKTLINRKQVLLEQIEQLNQSSISTIEAEVDQIN